METLSGEKAIEPVHKVTLCLGSNAGDRSGNVAKAIRRLADILTDMKISVIYETPEIHGIGTPYCNAVVEGFTAEDARKLNQRLKLLEILQGRTVVMRRLGIVPIDIDIVMMDDKIIRPKDYEQSFFQIGYKEILCKSC